MDQLEQEANRLQEQLTASLSAESETIQQWLWGLGTGELAPVQSMPDWAGKYQTMYTAALPENRTDGGTEVNDFLSFAQDYLSFMKTYGSQGDYAATYSQVVGDVQSLGEITELMQMLSDLGIGSTAEDIGQVIAAFDALGISSSALKTAAEAANTAVGAGGLAGELAGQDSLQSALDVITASATTARGAQGLSALTDALADTGTDAHGLGTILMDTEGPFTNVTTAIDAMTTNTAGKLAAVGEMFETLAEGIGQASVSITSGIQSTYNQAQENPTINQTITYEPTSVYADWQMYGDYNYSNTRWRAMYPGQTTQWFTGSNAPGDPATWVIYGPQNYEGGLATQLGTVAEIGPEWVVPTYEPYKSKFLQDVGADPYLIGQTIARQLVPLLSGGSSGGEIHVHVHMDGREIGSVVAEQLGTHDGLISGVRRISNG